MSDKEVVESLKKQELSDLVVTFSITPSIINVVGLKQPTLGKNQFRVKVDANQDDNLSTHLVSGAAVGIVNRGEKLKDIVVTEETSGCWKVEYHIHEEGVYVFIVTVDGVEAEGSPFKRIWRAELPKGTTVDRGQDWKWREQGGGDVGTVLGSGREVAASDKWVKVMWKNGGRNNYRWGAEEFYDLMIIDLPSTSEDYTKDMDSNILAETKLELLKSQFDVAKILLKKKSEELKETGRALEIAKAEIIDLTLQTSVLKDSKENPSNEHKATIFEKWDDEASSEMKAKIYGSLLKEADYLRDQLSIKERELKEVGVALESFKSENKKLKELILVLIGDPSDRDETVEYDKCDDDASSEMKRKLFKGLLSELKMVRSCLDNKEKELEESRRSLELVLSRVEPEELDPLKCMTRDYKSESELKTAYVGNLFYESHHINCWQVQFCVFRNFSVYTEYVKATNKSIDEDQLISFSFLDQYIELDLSDQIPHGWEIQPHEMPIKIQRADIDESVFNLSSLLFTVTASETPEGTQPLLYPIYLKGVVCDVEKIFMSLHFEKLTLASTPDGIQNSAEDEHKIEKSQGQHCSFNKVDVGLQFDYWVPMQDLLHGATVVDEVVFNAHGDKEQEYHWSECGFSLLVPEGALSKTATCPVAVKALISGRFEFPKGFQLISALYAISPGRKFTKDVKITLQHCFLIQKAEQLKRLCIVKAYPTKHDNPYVFEIVKGGVFKFGSQYCEVWLSDFSDVAAGILREMSDDNGNSNGSHTNGDSEEPESDEEGSETLSKQSEENETEALEQEHSMISGNQRDPTNIQPIIEVQPSIDSGTQSSLSELSSSNEGDIHLYRAHFFIESLVKNRWNFKLVGVKHLDVHIKYVNDTFKGEEKIAAFKFHFLLSKLEDQEAAIILEFTEEENKKIPRGWFVKPLTEPCSITQEDIDALSTQELRVQAHEEERVYPDIPMCIVSVFAEDDAAPHIQYSVKVEGIVEKKTVNIVRWLQRETQSSSQSPIARNESTDELASDDLPQLIGIVKSILRQCEDKLGKLLEHSMRDFADKLLAAKLIDRSVSKNPSYSCIINQIFTIMDFLDKKDEVEEHCNKFFSELQSLGGPFEKASDQIKRHLIRETKQKLRIELKLL